MLRSRRWLGVIAVCTFSYFVLSAQTWCAPQQGDTWHLDGPHSCAQFAVRHLGISTIRGAFTKFGGDVNYVPSDLSKSSVEVTIDASSVNTRVTMRDSELRSERFLDVSPNTPPSPSNRSASLPPALASSPFLAT